MAAIVSGSSLGLLNSSLYVLGSQGALGQASQGRAREQVYVNADTGNLVIQNRDELVVGRGPDLSLLRTYNSQGLFDGDNNDNWRFGVYRKVYNLTGTVNTAGSTVTRVAEDGSESVYTFDTTLGKYVCHDGGGSFDTLSFTSATQTWTWSWSDGTNQLTELYDNANGGRITKVQDQDGNALSFTYTAGLVTSVTNADGETTSLEYVGTDLVDLRTVTSGGQTIVRTRYAYDNHRLTTVTTDLSPEDASIADGKTYVVNYTYDGTSKRVATLTQTDGTRLTFAYVQVGADFRVQSITDALGNVTTYTTQTTSYPLNSGALTNPAGGWTSATALETGTAPVSQLLTGASNRGDAVAAWLQGGSLYASSYNRDTHVWSAPALVSGALTNISTPQLDVEYQFGVPILTWVDTTSNRIYAAVGAWDGSGTSLSWQAAQLVATGTGTLADVSGSVNSWGTNTVMWREVSGTTQTLKVSRWTGTVWGAAEQVTSGTTVITAPQIATTNENVIQVVWRASDGAAESLFTRGFKAGVWTAITTIETSSVPISFFRVDADIWSHTNVAWVQGNNIYLERCDTQVWTGAVLQTTSPAAISEFAYSDSTGTGGGAVAWITTDGRAYVYRVGAAAPELLASGATLADISVDRNGVGDTVVSWRAGNDVYATRLSGSTWSPVALVESSSAPAATPRVVITENGDTFGVWQQSDGTANSIFASRFTTGGTGSPYYTVQANDSWASIAQLLYGNGAAAGALQAALAGGASPTVGAQLTGFPATLPGDVQTDINDPLALGPTTLVTNAQGQLTRILMPAVGGVRQSTSFAYNANGDVTQITDARGLATTFGYDANGNRILERDAAGNTITRVFDSKNELLAETSYVVPDPDGAGPAAASSPLTTRYVYDASGHLRFVVSGEGRVTEYRYNSFGQRVAAIRYTGKLYDVGALTPTSPPLAETNLTSWLPADKSVSIRVDSTYDFRGQLATTTGYGKVDPAGVGVNDADKAVTNYVYDQAGNLLNTVDGRGSSTLYVYDGLGRLIRTTDAAGHPPTTTFYDDVNKKTVLTSANGLLTTSTYDAKGELISVVQSATPEGVLGTTSYFYDADGRLRRAVDPTGITSHILYDEAGRKIATIDGTGTLTEYRYDADNNLTRSIQYATALTVPQLASLSDAQGNPTAVTLNTSPAGAGIRPSALGQDRSSWNAYDNANQLVKSVDELGYVTQYFYDGAGRLTDVLKSAKAMTSTAALGDTPSPASIAPAATDPLDRLTRNFYDADGKLRGTLDGEGYLVEYKYNAAGQLIETVDYASPTDPTKRASGTLAQLVPAIADPKDIHTFTLYNAKGQVIGVVDGEGYLTEYVYDAAGNKTQTARYANRVTFPLGATITLIRPAASALDQVSGATYTALNQLDTATDALGTRTKYFYDNVGNLTQTVIAQNTGDARTLNAQYDKQGRLKAEFSAAGIATTYSYDADGRRTSVTDRNGARTLFYYDADGQLTHTIDALGEVTENRYNALGQLSQTVVYGTRLTSAALAGLNGGLVNAALTSAVGAIANAAIDSTTTYTYTLRGQVASIVDPLNQSTTTFFYDKDGDLVSKTEAVGKPEVRNTRYVYDANDRLVYTIDASGGLTKNEYDAEGRVTRTIAYTSAISNFASLPTLPTASDVASRLTVSSNDQMLVHVYDRDGREVYTIDALGEVTQRVYDAAGNVIQRIGYAKSIPANTLPTVVAVSAALTSVSDAVHDNNARIVYDTDNRLVYTIDGLGEITRNDYDARGNVVRSTSYANVLGITQLAGLGSSLTVAGVQSLIVASSALDRVEQRVFDADDRLVYTIDSLGFVQKNDYDALGNITRTTGYANAIALGTPATPSAVNAALVSDAARDKIVRWVYDVANQLVFTIDGLGEVTRNDYDARGNVVKVTTYFAALSAADLTSLGSHPAVGDVHVAINAQDHVTQHVFDTDNRLVYTIDALGFVDRTDYDALGQIIHTARYAQPIPLNTAPTLAAVAAALAANATGAAARALNLPGVSGSYASTPDSPANSVPGSIDIRVKAALADWTQASLISSGDLVSKDATANRDYFLEIDSTGHLLFQYTPDGSTFTGRSALSSVAVNFADGSTHWVRSAYNSSNGAVNFYTSEDYNPDTHAGTWTQLGTTQTITPGAIHDGTASVQVGSRSSGITAPLVAKFYYAEVLDGNGNVAAKFNPADAGDSNARAFTSSSGGTWTLSGSAVLDAPSLAQHQADFAYDAAGHLVYRVDGEGEVTRSDYDAAGDLIRTTDYATPVSVASLGSAPTLATIQARVAAQPALDHVEQHVLDAAGRALYDIDAAGYVTQFTYDGNGNLTQEVRYAKALLSFTPGVAPQIVTGPLDQVTRTVYDAANRPAFLIDPAGFVTQRFYDAGGNLVKEVQYANPLQGAFTPGVAPQIVATAATSGSYVITDALGDRVSRYVYDADGRARFIIDPMRYLTERQFDAFGQELKRIRYADPVVVPEGATAASVAALVSAVPASAVVTELHYDNVGRILDSIDGKGVVTRSIYDAFGNATDKIEALGFPEQRTTHSVYDALNRVVEQTAAFGTADASTRRFVLDSFGNEIAYIDPRGIDLAERDTDWAKAERLRLGYTVTAIGVTRVKLASELTAGDKANLLALYTTTQAFDGVNRKLRSTDPLGNVTWTNYDAFGNVVRAIDPNGNAGYLYHDQRNLLVAQVDPAGDLTEYNYDAAGNKTQTIRYATPVSVPYDPSRPVAQLRPKALGLPGAAGAYASSPDSTANSVTGDIDIRVKVAPADWTPGAAPAFLSKWASVGNLSYVLRLEVNGTLLWSWSTTGTNVATVASTAAVNAVDGTGKWIRIAHDVDNGSGGNDVRFYTSDDYDPSTGAGTWTQLGATVTTAGATSIFNSNSPLEIGSNLLGTATLLTGKMYYAEVRNGIDGAVATKFNPSSDASSSTGSFVSSTGETWTMNGTAALVVGAAQDEITTTFYDTLGRATQIVDAEGHAEGFTYDRNTNNVRSHQDKNGNLTIYEYDAEGNKIAEHLPVGSVVNRYEYDALGNKTKDILAQGLFEERVTQYVYDKNGKLIETIEPQVLTQQASSPAATGTQTLQGTPAGTATYEFHQVVSRPPGNPTGPLELRSSLTVSWPPLIGYGNGTVKVVWKTGHFGDLTATTTGPGDTSIVIPSISLPSPPAGSPGTFLSSADYYEVYVYKHIGQDDVLITYAFGNYANTIPAAFFTFTSQVPSVLHFTGQPADGKSMHVAYWPSSDPNNIFETDLKSYAAGTFSGMTQVPLDPLVDSYSYEAKVYGSDGEVLNFITGTFSAAGGSVTVGPIQAQALTSPALQTPHVYKAYDAAGNLVQETDAKGNVTRSYYDANNRLIGTVNAERVLRRYFYDAAGNLIAQRTYGDRIPDAVSLTTLPDPAVIAGVNPFNFREADYRYDAYNRETGTSTQTVLVYDRANGQRTQALVTARQYDRNGNVILETDANGNKTYTYYDKADRRIAQVDPSRYLTTWAYDAAGNVVRMTRYATALPETPPVSTSSNPAALAAQAAAGLQHADDRVCLYAYDRMNRMVQETTLGVQVATLDSSTGAVNSEQPANVVVQRRYDSAGNLIATIQDTAETDFLYDGLGRLVQELDPSFADFTGAFVRSSKTLLYDGVGNIRSVNSSGSITSYEYDPHGNVKQEIDPLGNPTRYYRDLNGNITVKHTRETNPDGTVRGINALYAYDKLNRLISSTEIENFTNYVRYDAYDEIVERGQNGQAREYDQYDSAGRLIKTNKDDGVDRGYLYDANGNETAKIQSGAQDIGIGPMPIPFIAALSPFAVQRTESAYDAKNQLTGVFQAPIAATPGNPNTQEVWVDALDNPFLGGTITPAQGGTVSYTFSQTVAGWALTDEPIPEDLSSSVDISLPPIVGYGEGNIKIVWNTGAPGLGTNGVVTGIVDKSATSAHVVAADRANPGLGTQDFLAPSYAISIYKQTPQGDVLITSTAGSYVWPDSHIIENFGDGTLGLGSYGASSEVKSLIHFDGQRSEAQSLKLWLWPASGSQPAVPIVLHRLTTADGSTPIGGQFVFDWSGMAPGQYKYEFQTFASADGSGASLDDVKGVVGLGVSPTGAWIGPQQAIPGSAGGTFPRIGMDSQGNGIAVWSGFGGVFASRYEASSGTWQPAQVISSSGGQAQVAVDSQGNAIAVWVQANGSVLSIFSNRYVAATGTWQGVVLAESSDTGSAGDVQLALDARGNAVIVWDQLDGTPRRNIFASHYAVATGTWQNTQIIATTNNTGASLALLPQVVMDAQGNAIAAWQQWNGQRYNIWAAQYVASSGAWQAAQLIDGNGTPSQNVKLAMDAQGNAIAVWMNSDPFHGTIYAARFMAATGKWLGTQLVDTSPTGDAWNPQIAMDAQGNAIVVWSQIDGTIENIYANRFQATGAWGTTMQLLETDDRGDAMAPQIGMDAQGNATVVWQQSDGTRTGIYSSRYAAATGTWQGAQTIESGSTPFGDSPQIAVAPSGGVLAVWRSTSIITRAVVPTKLVRTIQDITGGLSDAQLIKVGRTQSYNAFGQVAQEVDALGHVTALAYDTRGDLIDKIDPVTNATDRDGTVHSFAPTTHYYYDYLGRSVGERDAAWNIATRRYDAAGHLIFEYNPDSLNMGYREYRYDVRGNRRVAINELGPVAAEQYDYDLKNQLTTVTHPTDPTFVDAAHPAGNAPRIDTYAYDEQGRRISHTNALGSVDRTFYDDTGRVTRTVDAAGGTILHRYIFDSWSKGVRSITVDGDSRLLADSKDYFGRLLWHYDLGGHQFLYTYNKAGWLIQQQGDTNLAAPGFEQNIGYSYYQNGLLKETNDHALNARTGYEYDGNGNVTFEGYEQTTSTGPIYFEASRVRYDTLNRVTHVDDSKFSISYEYDRNGNRRHIFADYHDGLSGASQTQDYWYDYDALNRFTVTQGSLLDSLGNKITVQDPASRPAGHIDIGTTGTQIDYNKDGTRKTAVYNAGQQVVKDTYTYVDGLLTGTAITNVATGAAVGSATRTYDVAGEVTHYVESGSAAPRDSTFTYRPDGKVSKEVSTTTGTSKYVYDYDGTLLRVVNPQNAGGSTSTVTSYVYQYWDTAKQTQIRVQASNQAVADWQPGFSNFVYDVNGHLTEVDDVAGHRALSYALDARGLIIRRTEVDNGQSSKTQSYYYLNGVGIGDSGFAPSRTDYASVLASRGMNPKTAVPISSADFGSNYLPIDDRYPANTPGTYTIQSGELGDTYDKTLRNVALALWGDGSLWYVLADANGLTATSVLVVGQSLVVPNVVTNVHNNAGTFRVYDPGEAMGDTSPTLPDPPPPPRGDDCGDFGMIIVAVVVIVVTVVTDGATADLIPEILGEAATTGGWVGFTSAVVGAAAGSIAGQEVAITFGMQEHFSWSQVGMAALGAAVGYGIGSYAPPGDGGLAGELGLAEYLGKDASLAFNAMVRNLATQGVGRATGWQKTAFSWRSAAVSALAAPIANGIGDAISTTTDYDPGFGTQHETASDYSRWAGDFGTRLTTSLASGVATQALRRRFDNGKFDYGQIAADAFGNSIGNSLAEDLAKRQQTPANAYMAPWDSDDADRGIEIRTQVVLDNLDRQDAEIGKAGQFNQFLDMFGDVAQRAADRGAQAVRDGPFYADAGSAGSTRRDGLSVGSSSDGLSMDRSVDNQGRRVTRITESDQSEYPIDPRTGLRAGPTYANAVGLGVTPTPYGLSQGNDVSSIKAWDGKPGVSPYDTLNRDFGTVVAASMATGGLGVAIVGGEVVSAATIVKGGVIGGGANAAAQLYEKPASEFSGSELTNSIATGGLGIGRSVATQVVINVAGDGVLRAYENEPVTPAITAASSAAGGLVGEAAEHVLKFGRVAGAAVGSITQELTNLYLKHTSKQ